MPKRLREPAAALYPTPLVLVSSVDAAGKANIFTVVCAGIACAKPPMIGIGVHPWVYSHSLIESTGEFVVNIPTADLVEQVKYCGRVSGRDVDKFKETGLTPVAASRVKAPLIEQCPVNLECVVRQALRLGIHHLFLGEVVATHVDEAVLDAEGKVQGEKSNPLIFHYLSGQYWTLGKAVGGYGNATSQKSRKTT